MIATRARKAVFLDKDGTLVENEPHNVDPAKIRLYPDAAAALRTLAGMGFRLVVVSNQPGVAQGRFGESALRTAGATLRRMLRTAGADLHAFYYCPHDPRGTVAPYATDCDCRKPKPGLITRAADELGLDLADSWMLGDILHDVEAGNRAGCPTILVDRGNETEWIIDDDRRPHRIVTDLREAAAVIRDECGRDPRHGHDRAAAGFA